jgi:hypothetical protein
MLEDDPDKSAKPRIATGREMHERLARSGPPLDVTIQGLPRRRAQRSMEELPAKCSERRGGERKADM